MHCAAVDERANYNVVNTPYVLDNLSILHRDSHLLNTMKYEIDIYC